MAASFSMNSIGRVLVTLKTVWRDGTSHLLFARQMTAWRTECSVSPG